MSLLKIIAASINIHSLFYNIIFEASQSIKYFFPPMSIPSYLNTIMNSQLKNQSIEQVRSQITKLLSSESVSLKATNKSEKLQATQTRLHMTHFNFHIQHTCQTNKKSINNTPQAIFNKTIANKTNKRSSLVLKNNQIQMSPQKNSPEEHQGIAEWRKEMMIHLKSSKSQKNTAKELKLSQINLQQYPKLINKSKSIPIVFNKNVRSKYTQIKSDSPLKNPNNIVLIKPFTLNKDHYSEAKFKFTPKFTKSFHKNQSNMHACEQNHLTLQSLTNFYALVPCLGLKKAHAQPMLAKRKKYEPIFQNKNIVKHLEGEQFSGNVCGWQVGLKEEQ